jgi:NAD dependent epimerase/dehydratase
MKTKRVLVTGADGFIGSHLAEALVGDGQSVRALVLYNSFGTRGWLEHSAPRTRDAMEIVAGDVRDAAQMRELVKGCDVVMHLASLIAIPYSYQAPESYVATNLGGTLNLLLAAREHGVQSFVHTSTSEVYGTARTVPITEDHSLNAQSPYAASKIAADQMALAFHRSFAMPVTVIRPFNAYGPRQSARAVIPTIMTQVLSGAPAIRLGALHPTRDFNHVTDIARGFMAAAGATKAVGQVMNLGSNFEISIGEVAKLVAAAAGRPELKVEQDAQRLRPAASEVDRLWADASRAKALLGWEPKYGGMEGFRRGLTETLAWFRDDDNRRTYRPDAYAV